jgi:hypothetical protein
MYYLATAVFVVWLTGLYILAMRSRTHMQLALQNRIPEALPADFRRLGFRKLACNIDPGRFTEIGRTHLKRAIRTEDILFVWMLDGFLIVLLPLLK